jgi:hypothetical protein
MSFFSRFFGKSLKELFLAFSPISSQWRVVTWNFDNPGLIIEVHSPGSKNVIQNQLSRIKFLTNDELMRIGPSNDDLKALMNLAMHSTLKYSLERNHEFMVTPVAGATALDIQNETRALQWIEVSFKTLNGALDRFKEDSSLILTAAFFSGTIPDTGENVLRLIAFNLDIFYYLRPDSTLQIVIFNDKDLGHGSSRDPIFQQIIKVTKPQFYDEIARLVHRLAVVGELK